MMYRAATGAEPVYPDITSGQCCADSGYAGCMWDDRVPGFCANYEQYQTYIQKTGKCKRLADETYEWVYRAISIPIVLNCYCRYEKHFLKMTRKLEQNKCRKLNVTEPNLSKVLSDARKGLLGKKVENVVPGDLNLQVVGKSDDCPKDDTEFLLGISPYRPKTHGSCPM